MKRKLLSFAIAFALLSQTLVSAGPLSNATSAWDLLRGGDGSLPVKPGETITTTVTGKVKPHGDASYPDDPSSTTAANFDYAAHIDMTPVQTKFIEYYAVGADFGNDFENSIITGEFDVIFDVPSSVSQSGSATKPYASLSMPDGSIFEFVSQANTTKHPGKITYEAKVSEGTPLRASVLKDNVATYLKSFELEVDDLSTSSTNAKISVSMEGHVIVTEAVDSTPYARIDFDSNTSTVTAWYYSGGGGGGGGTKIPTVTTVGLPTDIKVIKIGSDYYIEASDLPTEDAEGDTIWGWYTDEELITPVSIDENGRIKIAKDTKFYYRTGSGPIANTVVDNDIDPVDVSSNDDGTFTVDMTTLPSEDNDGHTIYGWDLDEEHTTPAIANANGILKINSDTFLYPRTKPIAVTVVGTSISSVPVLQSDDETFTIDVDEIEEPEKEGFAFIGWYTEPNFINPVSGVSTINKDTYLYPQYRNLVPPEEMVSEEHILYVYGYPDGEVKPNGYITREEVAAIFCRLLKPEYRATIETDENSFPDVESGRWSNREISTMANGGYIVGDENGYFNPADPITRAEFTVIASKFAGIDAVPAENNFTDIEGHWAKDFILKAAGQYWITGYEDLTFRPQNKITRAEAMTMVNTMLVRYGDINSEYAKQWPDVKKTDWYYSQIIEATSHNYFTRNEDGWSETWIYADEDNNSHAR